MAAQTETSERIPLRDPAHVMRLARLGSFHQSRLSFMRILTRRMIDEKWTFSRPVFDIDAQGVGHAVFCAHTSDRTYSLVAFAHDLPADQRSDRVIAESWDSTFTLFDGIPDAHDIERLRQNIPLQEAGRVTQKELSVSRANRSVRLWDHVVSCLAAGQQPDFEEIAKVGYLMRTTAVYGSGKLGAADREMIADRPEFAAPFQVEMLSVFLIRTYVRDLAQQMANLRGGDKAVLLDPTIARGMGIGNSTGLGMAPFLLNHPRLINNWIAARETAIARVRSVSNASQTEIGLFRNLLARSVISVDAWNSSHPIQMDKLAILRGDLKRLVAHVGTMDLLQNKPWNCLFRWAEAEMGMDGQECLASLMLEPYGPLVDDLANEMSDTDVGLFRIDGSMTVEQVLKILERAYGWALSIDWTDKQHCARAWYVSEEKQEPRLGQRFDEPIETYEQPLAPGRDAAAMHVALQDWGANEPIAAFLLAHPEHRHSVRRTQIVERAPFAEVQDNTIGADLLPIDMLRCKLSFFGATHFDPRSDRWVRICLFGNAPCPEELQTYGRKNVALSRACDWQNVSYSLNEIEALSKRAARGAGMSWGMSEEAAKATRWLASHGLPAAGLLADTLTQNDLVPHLDLAPVSFNGIWQGRSGSLCPLICGATLNDCAAVLAVGQAIEMRDVSHPLLVVPFAAWAAIHIGGPVTVSWLDVRMITNGYGLLADGPEHQITMTQSAFVTCKQGAYFADAIPMPKQRGNVRDVSWARLNAFAHRTYAHATEESRLLGAGAGTSDND